MKPIEIDSRTSIVEHLGKLSEPTADNSLVYEVNLIKRDDREPRYDIRKWCQTDYKRSGSHGIELTADELRTLYKVLEIYYTQSERYTRALTRFRAERMEK